MLSEIFGLLSSISTDAGSGKKFRVNLNKNRIRSISAYSSNSIFYFPMILSDQATPEEAAMISRMTEKMNASFVVACISLMPFHRIKADDKAAIEDYLKQFHQNLGFRGDISGAAMQKFLGFASDSLSESFTPQEIEETQKFLMECWEKSKAQNSDFVKLVSETVSLHDMFNEDAIDPKTRVMQAQYWNQMDEMNIWGFVGEATEEMFEPSDDDLIDDDFDEYEEDEDWEDEWEDDEIDPDDYPEDGYDDLMNILGESSGGIIGFIKKTFNIKTEKDKQEIFENELKTIAPKIVKFDFKKAYDDWYLTCFSKNYDNAMHNAKVFAAFAKAYFDRDVGNIMVCKVSEYLREYGFDKKYCRYDSNGYFVAVSLDAFGNSSAYAKDVSGGRYFTDIVNNQVNIMLNATNGHYKPKSYINMDDVEAIRKYLSNNVNEATMKAAKRNSLPDEEFGLPSQRKFPLNDKKHVRLAIQMFKHCPEKDRKELAGNIKKAADKFGMKVDTEGTAKKYLSESSVGEAIASIKFSLEAVSENKILSCKNLTKLNTLESKLKKLKNRYIKYLNRYKKQYKENKKKGTNKKLVIRFNNMTIGDPKAFMVQFGSYIKIINKRLKLVEKRRAQLHSAKGDVTMVKDFKDDRKSVNNESTLGDIGQMEFAALDHCIRDIEQQVTAPDDQVFTLVDDTEDDELNEATDATPGYRIHTEKEYNDAMNKASLRGYQKGVRHMGANFDKQSRELQSTRAQLDMKDKLANRYKDKARQAEREGQRLKGENERLEKKLQDQQKTRAQLRNDKGGVGTGRPQSSVMPYYAADAKHTEFHTFDRQVFTDMDMQKANDAIPTFAKASIGFVIDDTEEVVSRDVLVGIKSYIHRAPSMELINDVYNCIINKRKFLKFVKFITGEERSLSDLMFGIKELRSDALDGKKGAGQWRSAFKRRRRWAKISIPYLMREYTPNGTLVMTMNEVDFIKSEYGIDIMSEDHVRMIMDADFLLSFVILDQANEMVYVVYDGQGTTFQQYGYQMLERERAQSDRMMREMYRAFSR